MVNFTYRKATGLEDGLKLLGTPDNAVKILAGGTTLIDLMKLEVEKPGLVIDVNALPYNAIEKMPGGGLKIGAGVKNADLATNADVRGTYKVLSEALLSGASPQLRNKATTAGNLLQRTRCVYFRDPHKACNKREPGSGCSAIEGFNRNLAIMGTSEACIATNPSDMNIAMLALDATVHVQSVKGTREIKIADFHLLPGKTPHLESTLQPGEIITHVSLPPQAAGTQSMYLKLRDRASYEFALASAAIVVRMQGPKIANISIAMGGIGTKPWRNPDVEKMLVGQTAANDLFRKAAETMLAGAKPASQNGFKIELAKRCLVHALEQAVRA